MNVLQFIRQNHTEVLELTGEHLRELRVAEVVEQDLVITDGKVEAYRTKLKVSFKYEGHA